MNNQTADRQDVLSPAEIQAFQSIVNALNPLNDEARRRLLESAATLLRIEHRSQTPDRLAVSTDSLPLVQAGRSAAPFSSDTEMSPKEFLFEKKPQTDVERIACLAYYLTHYRATPHFKTMDLSLLNTEAAQPKFSNTAFSSNNAVKLGYLVPSTKGQRQISAAGERFVLALPDRAAAKEALASIRRRARAKKGRNGSIGKSEE
jgi:hypothetical protein